MFQLVELTQVTITNANPRRELHGEEKVRAIDLAFGLSAVAGASYSDEPPGWPNQ